MVPIDAVICLQIERDACRDEVVYYIRVGWCRKRVLRQYACRHLTETTRRNHVAGERGTWRSAGIAARRHERWIRGPSDGNVNRYRSATLRVDQTAEVTGNFRLSWQRDRGLRDGLSVPVIGEIPEGLVSPVVDLWYVYRPAERKGPVGFNVLVGLVNLSGVVCICIKISAGRTKIVVVPIKEKGVPVLLRALEPGLRSAGEPLARRGNARLCPVR